jgi:nitrite reductase (NADH) large subunit
MLRGQPQPVSRRQPRRRSSRPWQAICELTPFPQAGIGARLGERQIALFRFGEQVYALDNLEPGSEANVLSRGMLGDAAASRW